MLDLVRWPWLELVGKTKAEMDRLVPTIRDKSRAGMDRAARRRLEKEQRKEAQRRGF